MKNNIEERIGTVSLQPRAPIIAGSTGQWRFVYTAGAYGIDEGGTLLFVQRTACDWEVPQTTHPAKSGFTTVVTNARTRLDARFEPKKDIRPWQKWCFVIDVHDGFIAPGEQIVITLGDQSQGSPGIRAQTFIERAHEFRFRVDPTNANMPAHLPSSPVVSIVAGEAEHLVCITPSQLLVGQQNQYHVRADDKWGNPTGLNFNPAVRTSDPTVLRIEKDCMIACNPGNYRLFVSAGPLSCESNPAKVVKPPTGFNRYWGDLHAQTGSTVGTGTDDEYFAFARDQARLDFTSHQANDFMVSDRDWEDLNRLIRHYHTPGRFVVFSGYEWSGNTPCGGDHNVIFLNDNPPIYRSSHWQVPEVPEDRFSPANPVTRLYERFKNNPEVILIPHVGGRYANIRKFFDPALIPVVEIVSSWGVFEWMLWDALDMGHKVGIVCSSDGHKGRPGAESPGAGAFGIQGGLTCVLAKKLTRESIFEALKHRRCYGTTGARIFIDFNANGKPMGSELKSDQRVVLSAEVLGTAPIEALLLFEGRNIVKRSEPEEFKNLKSSRRVRVAWGGARIRGRARKARWDGIILLEGTKLLEAKPYAFDAPSNGITRQSETQIEFRSGTTGDMDGIDLILEDPYSGKIVFDSLIGNCCADLEKLSNGSVTFEFGGLDLRVSFQRYPEKLSGKQLSLSHAINPIPGTTAPYYLKAIQEDGQMAWTSPIFIMG